MRVTMKDYAILIASFLFYFTFKYVLNGNIFCIVTGIACFICVRIALGKSFNKVDKDK